MNAQPLAVHTLHSSPQLSPGAQQVLQVRQALAQAWPALAEAPEALNALARLGRSHRVRTRCRLWQDGHVNKGSLWLLVRGKVSMGKRASNGKWWQSHSLNAGEWLDLSSAWSQSPYPETAQALSAVLAHEYPAAEVLALSQAHPPLLNALLSSLAQRTCEAIAARQALTLNDFAARLAEWLLQELRRSDSADHLILRELKRDLAAQLGATPETLSRTLRQFQQDGLIDMRHNDVWIPDAQRLARIGKAGLSI
ncbi:Crp/Fnr family transcriptional regulator [Roseateles koreensis]|uniref:Crp/Fnr family transcriptional regulator n=1 Tax=Roseateles koreensis TaxID=2987526 RepID=A0ABT5KUD5_9BURK|nr:Crp/Fnr family transcriptional regulator [Roseateles koreensis]MDC8786421.1 Crp/Fnr family transcriptional regulator [Roseateles koreensis]